MTEQHFNPLHANPRAFAALTAEERLATAAPGTDRDFEVLSPIPETAGDPLQAAARVFPRKRKPDAVFAYRDADGQPIFYMTRWDARDGRDKELLPLVWVRHANGREDWQTCHHPRPRPLYGLDRLANAPHDAPIFLVEGEKCADVAALKLVKQSVPMTWVNGSNSVDKTDWEPLRGRRVHICPDADAAGSAATADLVTVLSKLDCKIKVVDIAALACLAPNGTKRDKPKEGWDIADAIEEWGDCDALREAVEAHLRPLSGPRANADHRSETPANGAHYRSFGRYKMTTAGLMVTVKKGIGKNATEADVWTSSAFELIGRVRDPYGNGWAKLLRWRDEDGRLRTHSVGDADIHSDPRNLCANLAGMGLKIARGCGGFLADYINAADVERRVTTVGRTGWHDIRDVRCFVLPDHTLGEPSGEGVILTGAGSAPFETSGNLMDWQAGVGQLVAGHSRHVFMVSAAFVGPLLQLARQEGGGVHLFGNSSTGKSTAIEAAASVWGRGATPGFVRSWRSTANALEASAALHTDTALVLDELGVVDPREAAAAAYQLAIGSGKGRSARDGSLRTPMTWRTFFLSTGEMRLADKLIEAKQRATAGQAVRLVDIPADAGQGFGSFDHGGVTGTAKDIADAIKRAAGTHYGTAGPAFIERIIARGVDEVAEVTLDMMARFPTDLVPEQADGQVLRAADRFALVAVAGELAIELGVAPWPPGESLSAAKACFLDWLAARGGSGAQEVREVIARVRGFIEAHGDSRFERLDAPNRSTSSEGQDPLAGLTSGHQDRPIINRAGYRRGEGAAKEWLISPETWRNEVVVGFNPKLAAGWLCERGMLERGPDAFSKVEKVDGRSQRFYVVKAALLAGDTHV